MDFNEMYDMFMDGNPEYKSNAVFLGKDVNKLEKWQLLIVIDWLTDKMKKQEREMYKWIQKAI